MTIRMVLETLERSRDKVLCCRYIGIIESELKEVKDEPGDDLPALHLD